MKTEVNNGDFPMNAKTLISQLIAAVRKESVRRALKERVLQEPDINFLNKRECALTRTDMKKSEVKIN